MTSPPTRRSSAGALHVVALMGQRLRATRGGRVARITGALVAVGFGVAAFVARSEGGGRLATAAWILVLTAGVPLALASANDRAAKDRADGIEALASARGSSRNGLEAARLLGAMFATARSIALPLVVVAIASLAAGPSRATAIRVVGALAFSAIVGGALGSLGAICGRIARRRGPWLWVGVVVVPWALADVGSAGFSLPHAIRALSGFTLSAQGPAGSWEAE